MAMPDPPDALAGSRQVEIYGESWSNRLSRLLRGYGLSQARLGAVIGLSAPMVSQLMTGHRVKISFEPSFAKFAECQNA